MVGVVFVCWVVYDDGMVPKASMIEDERCWSDPDLMLTVAECAAAGTIVRDYDSVCFDGYRRTVAVGVDAWLDQHLPGQALMTALMAADGADSVRVADRAASIIFGAGGPNRACWEHAVVTVACYAAEDTVLRLVKEFDSFDLAEMLLRDPQTSERLLVCVLQRWGHVRGVAGSVVEHPNAGRSLQVLASLTKGEF